VPSEAPVWLAEQHLLGFLGDIGGLSAGAKADFLRAVALAPPDSIDGLYWRARVTLLRRVEDLEAFDRLFDAWFRDAPKPPVEAVEPARSTLVLLTRRYPPSELPRVPGRVYVQPSEPIPIETWDYASPDGVRAAFALGARDGIAFAHFAERALEGAARESA